MIRTTKPAVLIVDDDPSVRELLYDILSDEYSLTGAGNGPEGLKRLEEENADLVLVDMNMPYMTGIEFIENARLRHPDTAYIIISGNRDIQAAIDAIHHGVWDYITKPFADSGYLKKVIRDSIEKKDLIVENRKYKQHLENLVRERTEELEMKNRELLDSRNRIIGILSRAAEYKDFETGQHFVRVSRYCEILAQELDMDGDMVSLIRQASPVHDIGKIGTPERVLMKPSRLDEDEIREMRKHCIYGEDILRSRSLGDHLPGMDNRFPETRDCSDELLEIAANIARCHHERYDGSGYPSGLAGGAIPMEARIAAVADVYDALGSERPYKEAWPEEACQSYLLGRSGTHFDPHVVRAFFSRIDKILEVKALFSDVPAKEPLVV